jgi:hypothetical protein
MEQPAYPFEGNEFRLNGREPASLKAFEDLYLKGDSKSYHHNRIIWVREGVFVRLGVGSGLPRPYRQWRFVLHLINSDEDSQNQSLRIHSSTLEEALSGLDFLFGLQDDHYKEIRLDYYSAENGRPPVCPLPNLLLKKLVLQNENRRNIFSQMTFTPDQCCILATSGTKAKIVDCWFQDGGIAFVEVYAARDDDESGPAKLTMYRKLTFDEGNLALFLDQRRLDYAFG